MALYQLEDRIPELPADDRYWIAPDAKVIGSVRVGVDCSIWFGAVLRGDNELIDLLEGTNIQDGSMLHTDMGFPMSIGPFATVGHAAILHGCTIGDVQVGRVSRARPPSEARSRASSRRVRCCADRGVHARGRACDPHRGAYRRGRPRRASAGS